MGFPSTFLSVIDGRSINGTFKVGDTFIRDNCSERCTCFKRANFGLLSCEPLCVNKPPPVCSTYEIIKAFQLQVNKTKCFCSEKRCVKRKYCFVILKINIFIWKSFYSALSQNLHPWHYFLLALAKELYVFFMETQKREGKSV